MGLRRRPDRPHHMAPPIQPVTVDTWCQRCDRRIRGHNTIPTLCNPCQHAQEKP